jgi:DNA-binding beta-propeller fold protein YncE
MLSHPVKLLALIAVAFLLFHPASRANAQQPGVHVIVSANDNKVALVDGVAMTVRNPPPDTATVIDVSTSPPRVVAELPVAGSIIGPPQSAAVSPDRSIAMVTAAARIDPADPSRTIPADIVTVIDLQASPPTVLNTLRAGRGASGVSINPAGTLALVANRMEGTISVFTIDGKQVEAAGKVDLGAPESGPCHVIFTPDGRSALVTRNNDSLISLLRVNGSTVEHTKGDIAAGLKPYGIDVAPDGAVALVANIGAGATGGADTVSVIDLRASPPRAVDHLSVGPTAEGVSISPDGRYAAVTVMNGSNLAKSSPLFNDFGKLRILALKGTALVPVTEARVGHWCQGAGWSADSDTVLVQCAAEREILVFRFDGSTLVPGSSIKVNGGPSGFSSVRR